jgi:2-methylcitrate dehydratase PrpD
VCLAYEEDADCDLPAEAVHHTKGMLIDTLGCAIGGHVSKPRTMAWALAANVFSQQPASVLGSGQPREVRERYTIWSMARTWSYPHIRLW